MSRPSTLPQPWIEMANLLGGVQALADALCCNPVTLRRWANGSQTPNRATQAWIRRGFEEVGIEPLSFGKQIEND